LTKTFRERLENFELPVGGDVWEKIARDLPPVHRPVMRVVWTRRIALLAACMLLLLGMQWYFSAVRLDTSDENRILSNDLPIHDLQPELQRRRLADNDTPQAANNGSRQDGLDPQSPASNRKIANEIAAKNPKKAAPSNQEEMAVKDCHDNADQSPQRNDNADRSPQRNDNTDRSPQRNDNADRWADVPITRRKFKPPVMLALAYGNQGTSPSTDLQGWYPRAFSDATTLSKDLLPNNLSATDVRYDMPVAVSLSVRKQLVQDWALESGLTYTYLKSTETESFPNGNATSKDIRLHYIGVPLKLVYSFYDNHRLSLYASAGGMLEKCVSGQETAKNTTTDLGISELQWSLSGNVGMNYKLSNAFGLFVEPGINYYFDDHSAVQTIRKDKPLNVGVQFGLRLTYSTSPF
jgi:hypothetical protein